MTVFLIGFMGCGKTTIGRRVARMLGWRFVDMDRHIESDRNKTIADIFATEGEKAFRAMERDFLENFRPNVDCIVAAGGGAACYGDNIDVMNAKGATVYLEVSPRKLYGRLEKKRSKRPKLAGLDDGRLMDFIVRSLSEREPYYRQASHTIKCEGLSDGEIAESIAEMIFCEK